ncbi:hypothetical protein myaer102_24390 [Microcystis viridis NIES-102]|uniref:Uncharacterized protein n=1 Tax=Microcystis viridis NIES-102 TaxID=213615 RepID=A0A3G9K3L4_MICVR|nr:hypothetical protein myaer102_24390 [Microcystis viridis NIES-102]
MPFTSRVAVFSPVSAARIIEKVGKDGLYFYPRNSRRIFKLFWPVGLQIDEISLQIAEILGSRSGSGLTQLK